MKLYMTAGCHLCDDAEAVLRMVFGEHVVIEKVDIALDDHLLETWGKRIPVVEFVNGETLCWPFGPLDVVRKKEKGVVERKKGSKKGS